MNKVGKKNIVFGFAYMVITVALGMFLANKLGSGDASWFDSEARSYLKTAHVHGNLEGFFNVMAGFVLAHFGGKVMMLARIASVTAMVGAIFHSGMLFLAGLGLGAAMNLAPVGAISTLVTAVLLAVITYKGFEE